MAGEGKFGLNIEAVYVNTDDWPGAAPRSTLRATHRLDQKGRRVPRALSGHSRPAGAPDTHSSQRDHADQLAPMALTARHAPA